MKLTVICVLWLSICAFHNKELHVLVFNYTCIYPRRTALAGLQPSHPPEGAGGFMGRNSRVLVRIPDCWCQQVRSWETEDAVRAHTSSWLLTGVVGGCPPPLPQLLFGCDGKKSSSAFSCWDSAALGGLLCFQRH